MATPQDGPGIGICRTVASLRARVQAWRREGRSIGLVPTMGALHDGHLALVRHARERCDKTVVSIFVNPSQFGPTEDFGAYPRNETDDLAKLAALGTQLAFIPSVEEMYGEDAATTVSVGGVSEGLCGRFRPGHFEGVATVVAKLLLQCLPDLAVFGEKDYQQLQVIKHMTRDLAIPVTIEGFPTVRDEDGIALSSRNAYLTPEQRQTATRLNKVLRRVVEDLESGANTVSQAQGEALAELEAAGFDRIDYLEVCDTESLVPIDGLRRPARVLAAVHLGATRLIDNMAVKPSPAG